MNGENKIKPSCQRRDFWLFRMVDKKKGQKEMKRMEKKWKQTFFYDANEVWHELNTKHYTYCMFEFFEMALLNVLRHITIQPLYIMIHKIHWFICHVHIQSTKYISHSLYLENSERAESRIHCYYFWPISMSIPKTKTEL